MWWTFRVGGRFASPRFPGAARSGRRSALTSDSAQRPSNPCKLRFALTKLTIILSPMALTWNRAIGNENRILSHPGNFCIATMATFVSFG